MLGQRGQLGRAQCPVLRAAPCSPTPPCVHHGGLSEKGLREASPWHGPGALDPQGLGSRFSVRPLLADMPLAPQALSGSPVPLDLPPEFICFRFSHKCPLVSEICLAVFAGLLSVSLSLSFLLVLGL